MSLASDYIGAGADLVERKPGSPNGVVLSSKGSHRRVLDGKLGTGHVSAA
ncbi:hypothetical protein [Amycolatopsis regifaucium]|nr:hypothetical protein [Amycolatopsis regifaucium]